MKPPTRPSPSGSRIVTLTMNPALDITTTAERVRPTEKVRCHGARYDAGGGGINVARIAHVLGASVSAIFPAGGQSGDVVTDFVRAAGVTFRRIKIAEATRESFTVNEACSGQQYRFILPGPRLSFAEQAQCLDELRIAARSAEFVVASGSLPPGVPAAYYQRIADICTELGTLLILDTSGGGLQHITSGVFLLKASVRELRECVGCDLTSESDQVAAAQELIQRGRAQIIVVSLGSNGALLVTPLKNQRFSALPMRSGSGVGAGDAMVAAITVGLSHGWPIEKSLRFGIAAGAAMLMTPGTAPCNRADVERLFETVPEPTEV
ncbi:1-phosphofructokinase family hexose kinase [uncultured Mycobacterium sp.]|uniref:1-phosphofructokinase family hexose kinase n=1 Tax=uncultured Mycobacterium sp. TaxID=171292 RepID=UPI0035C9EB99